MKFFNGDLCKGVFCMVNHVIDSAKVVLCFYDVINVNRIFSNTDSRRLKNHARLIKGEFASLNVIRIVGKFNLNLMVNAAFNF